MITEKQIEKGYQNGVITLETNPQDEGTVARIGEYWFYFDWQNANTLSLSEYKKETSEQEIVRHIFDTLDDMHMENPDEYAYYEAILIENEIVEI